MNKPLWDHQLRDRDRYLQNASLLNTSDPGTGKTRTIIEVLRVKPRPTLILAPKSILQCAWGNDIEEFGPELTYAVATAENRAAAFASDALIKITNIDAVTWLQANPKYLKQFAGGWLVIDESTSVKNPKSKRTKAAMTIREVFADCTCMSGTPSPQGIIDLWAQMFLVDYGERLGPSYYRFRNLAYLQVMRGAFATFEEKEGVADAVAGLVADVTIRNRREDCLDLPPNQVVHRRTTLAPKHMAKYVELKKRAVVELETGDVSAINAAALLTKLLQVASGAVYDENGVYHVVDTTRYELVMDLVEERPQSVVVFNWTHQREEMMALATKRGISVGVIDGSATLKQRTERIEQFQAGKLQCIMLHPASAAHGVTLTKGVATIWSSPTYNAEFFEQANARIYRGGQTQNTETILICADGTAEKDVYAKLSEKTNRMINLLELL